MIAAARAVAARLGPVPEPNPGLRRTSSRSGRARVRYPGQMNPIKLSANESHHGPSPAAAEAYRRCAAELFRYPDGAQVELRRAIAETFGLRVEGIVCGNGSDELLQLLIRAYVRPGDDVVLSRNSFAMAYVHATAQGARLVHAEEPQLRPDTDRLLQAVTPGTRIVILASPNNPVGQYLPERRALATAAQSACRSDPDRRCRVCRLRRCGRFRVRPVAGRGGLEHGDDPHVLQAVRTRRPANRLDVRAGQHRRRRDPHPHAVQRIGGRDGGGGRRRARRALQPVGPRLQ